MASAVFFQIGDRYGLCYVVPQQPAWEHLLIVLVSCAWFPPSTELVSSHGYTAMAAQSCIRGSDHV
jgi:hypothetical protein